MSTTFHPSVARRIGSREFKYIMNAYGFNVVLRKRVPIVENPVACTCITEDDIFNQIRPDCPLCGGTGIIDGESFRDYTIKIILQPVSTVGMTGSEMTYSYPTKMERVHEIAFVKGTVPVDLGDYIIDTYTPPEGGSRTIEYDVFDKEIWRVGVGNNRRRNIVYQRLKIRKAEYTKTISTMQRY